MKDERGPKSPKRDGVKEQSEHYDVNERFEIIDGMKYDLLASPTLGHQILVTRLSQAIDSTCHTSGTVIVAPMDVYLDEDNTVQPDIIYIANENSHIMKKTRIEGAPDLLVEILSRSTGKHDRGRKKALYERFGISEFWIVDPEHFIVEQFALKEGAYELQAVYGENDTVVSERLTCIEIHLNKLFEAIRKWEQ